MVAASLSEGRKARLFPSAAGRSSLLTGQPVGTYNSLDNEDRIGKVELSERAFCHTFRATGITTYPGNGGKIENARQIAAHESPKTTKICDRTSDQITLEEVERIII